MDGFLPADFIRFSGAWVNSVKVRTKIPGGYRMLRHEFFGRLRNRLIAFRSAKSGNVALIFAFTMIPMIGLVGAGVDYSRAARIKTIMQAAADAAALGSIAQASQGYTAALSMNSPGPVPAAQTQAVNIFNGE